MKNSPKNQGVALVAHPLSALGQANVFVAKWVLDLGTTKALIERLSIDRSVRRICGFSMHIRLPSEAIFSRAFDEFATSCLAERVHEVLIKEHLSRNGTAIPARQRPVKKDKQSVAATPVVKPAKRGCPRRGEVCPAVKENILQIQRKQTLEPVGGKPFLFFGTNYKTSDFMADGLLLWWQHRRSELPGIKLFVINLGNEPHCNGRRSQFLLRMTEFAEGVCDWFTTRPITVNTTPLSATGRDWKNHGTGHRSARWRR